jgi:quercetin dioxygenase-like cupin family protein
VEVVRGVDDPGFAPAQHGLSGRWLRGPLQDDGLDSALIRFEPGASTPLHVHHGGQVLYAVSGRGFVEVNGLRTELEAGDIVVTPPAEAHVHGALDDGEFVHLSVTTGRNELLGDTDLDYPGTAPGTME